MKAREPAMEKHGRPDYSICTSPQIRCGERASVRSPVRVLPVLSFGCPLARVEPRSITSLTVLSDNAGDPS